MICRFRVLDRANMGKTNNPKGRQKGIPNKVTAGVKDVIKGILEWYTNPEAEVNFSQDFGNLKAPERVKTALKLMEFVVPKLQRTTIEDNTERKREIDAVIEKLIK